MSSLRASGPEQDGPFVVEFAVNLRWLLHRLCTKLDPSLESHYGQLLRDAAAVLNETGGANYAALQSLALLPLGALQLAREGMLYLLVSETLLPSCPVTLHAFLLRAACTIERGRTYTTTSDTENKSATQAVTRSVDTRLVGSLTHAPQALRTSSAEDDTATQAMLLLLRWLLVERVVPMSELYETLAPQNANARQCAADAVCDAVIDMSSSEGFALHKAMAGRLAQLMPFYLGAHLVLTRALLLYATQTSVTCEAVMQHVHRLCPRNDALTKASNNNDDDDDVSEEVVLLRWVRCVLHLLRHTLQANRKNKDEGSAVIAAAVRCLNGLCVRLQGECSLYHVLQDGVVLCLVLHFYEPAHMALDDIVFCMEETCEGKIQTVSDASYANWSAVLRTAEVLRVWPGLSVAEVVQHGAGVLMLHLLRLVQDLFAALATRAEEDVRVDKENNEGVEVAEDGEHVTGQQRLTPKEGGHDALGETSKSALLRRSCAFATLRASQDEQGHHASSSSTHIVLTERDVAEKTDKAHEMRRADDDDVSTPASHRFASSLTVVQPPLRPLVHHDSVSSVAAAPATHSSDSVTLTTSTRMLQMQSHSPQRTAAGFKPTTQTASVRLVPTSATQSEDRTLFTLHSASPHERQAMQVPNMGDESAAAHNLQDDTAHSLRDDDDDSAAAEVDDSGDSCTSTTFQVQQPQRNGEEKGEMQQSLFDTACTKAGDDTAAVMGRSLSSVKVNSRDVSMDEEAAEEKDEGVALRRSRTVVAVRRKPVISNEPSTADDDDADEDEEDVRVVEVGEAGQQTWLAAQRALRRQLDHHALFRSSTASLATLSLQSETLPSHAQHP